MRFWVDSTSLPHKFPRALFVTGGDVEPVPSLKLTEVEFWTDDPTPVRVRAVQIKPEPEPVSAG